jgi:hypothetical protein
MYLTGNPIGSTDARDFIDDVVTLEYFVLSEEGEYVDRLNVAHKTLAGMRLEVRTALDRVSYQILGDYAAGLVVENFGQVFRKDGEFYRADAELVLPYELTGDWLTEAASFVAVGDAILRQELADYIDVASGAALVGRAVRHINDVAELRTVSGRYDGDVVRLTSYYDGWAAEAVPAPRGGGFMVWVAGSTAADDGVLVFAVTGISTGRWTRPLDHILTVDDAGLVHEASPITDQAARVQAFLDAASGRHLVAGRQMKVGIASTLSPQSDTKFLANGFELFTLDTFVGDTGFQLAIKHVNVKNVFVDGLVLDGNQAAFGGLYPVVNGDLPRGIGVSEGCESITYQNTLVKDVVMNAFIHLSGGAWAQSKNVRFIGCIARNSGVGFGQEIKTGSPVVTNEGPGYTLYDNCWADLCNFGLYLAGGRAHLNGGLYHSKRLQALTCYTGDAHAESYYTGITPRFRITPEVGANSVGLIHCINKADTQPNYNLQQLLQVNFDSPEFVCDHTGVTLQLETGVNVTLNSPKFAGGGNGQINGVVTTSTGGPYRNGNITINDPQFTKWADTADSVIPRIPMTLNRPSWFEPGGVSCGCLRMNATGQKVTVVAPQFGSAGSTQQPQHGISSSVSGTTLICRDAVDDGLTGSMFNVALANAGSWIVENSGASIVNKHHLGSATFDPASMVDGSGQTTSVTVAGANVGDFAEAAFSNALQGITVTAWVSAANTVQVRFQNESGATVDLASGTLWARTTRPV